MSPSRATTRTRSPGVIGGDPETRRARQSYTTDARRSFGPTSGTCTTLDNNAGSFGDALDTNMASAPPDGSWLVLPGGSGPADYVLDYPVLTSDITGFRLEALVDPSLPATGPGWAGNGNFQLSEIAVTYVPEPIAVWILGAGYVLRAGLERRKNRDPRTPPEHGRRIRIDRKSLFVRSFRPLRRGNRSHTKGNAFPAQFLRIRDLAPESRRPLA